MPGHKRLGFKMTLGDCFKVAFILIDYQSRNQTVYTKGIVIQPQFLTRLYVKLSGHAACLAGKICQVERSVVLWAHCFTTVSGRCPISIPGSTYQHIGQFGPYSRFILRGSHSYWVHRPATCLAIPNHLRSHHPDISYALLYLLKYLGEFMSQCCSPLRYNIESWPIYINHLLEIVHYVFIVQTIT